MSGQTQNSHPAVSHLLELADALAKVAGAVGRVPRDQRQALVPQLAALAAAQDSAVLLADLLDELTMRRGP
jgi:hypothetical protein